MFIRPATIQDIPTITKLKNIPDTERYSQRVVETELGKANYLVAEIDSQLVGQVFLKYYGTPKYPHYPNMEDLLVAKDYRHQGVGSSLIEQCEQLARFKGFKQLGLSVNPTLNSQAMGLYQKLGYQPLGSEPYLDGVYNGVEDWVIDLVKTL